MQNKAKIQLDTDDKNLIAKIILIPDPEGGVWNQPKIINFLEEKGIIEGIFKKNINILLKTLSEFPEFLSQNSNSKAEEHEIVEYGAKSISAVVAKGTPPQAGTPTVWKWEDIEIPSELQEDVQKVLQSARPVKITRQKVEKVKIQKKVKKKGLLAMTGKEEVITAWEDRKIEEPVQVDLTILASGWIEENEVMGKKEKGSVGKTGKSVYGKPILPDSLQAEDIVPGKGVRLEKDTLVAEYTGVVRRGKNWIEVLPFNRHQWNITLSKDKRTCYLQFEPGSAEVTKPDVTKIVAKAVSLGFDENDLIDINMIDKTITESIEDETASKDIPLTKSIDSSFSIDITENKLKAVLSIKKGSGQGKPLSLKEVGDEIKKSGFKGLDKEKIKKDILDFYYASEKELKEYVLVEGKVPTNGVDRKLEFTCNFVNKDEIKKLKIKSETTKEDIPSFSGYPVSDVTNMALVKKDTVVAAFSTPDKGETGQDVFGKVVEGSPGKEPAIELLENVRLEKDSILPEIDGILDIFDNDGHYSVRVRPYKDAVIEINMDHDKMRAYITLENSYGSGIPLSLENINNEIKKAGVEKGINGSVIENSLQDALVGNKGDKIVFAEGVPPTEPGMSRLQFLIQLASGKGVTLGKDGKADYRNQDRITIIKKDDKFAKIVSPDVTPKDGWDITGKTIPAKEPPPLSLEIGENIRQEKDDKGDITLIADRNGELFYDKKKINVNIIRTIQGDVDLTSGNIKFSGSVQVTGNVLAGFYVMAGGTVQIGGSVEGALVSAGESVTIIQGVVGAGKAVIRTKKDIEMIFAEQATLLAVGDVRVKNACFRCHIKCNGSLTLLGEKGNLIGGTIQSRKGVSALNIGSVKEIKTEISFGQDYLIMDQIEQEEQEIKKTKDTISRLDFSMGKNEKEGNIAELNKIRKEKLQQLKIIEKRSIRLFTLRERFEEHYDSKIVVKGTLYPGVVIESHGRFFEVQEKKKQLVLFFNSETGKIEEQSLKDPSTGKE